MRINKHDTNGTKPLLGKGELGYDDYTAGGDTGRVFVGTGAENIAQAKKAEVVAVDGKVDTHIARSDNPHSVTKAQVGLGSVDNTSDATKNVLSAAKWTTPRTITLSGDVTGSVSIDGSANATITTTVAANSIALGTDTTGNYVAGNTAGTGITVTGTAGEGWSPTISIDNTVATLTGAQTLTNKTLQDSTTFIVDSTDATKKVQFDVAGVTTATTRTMTIPNVNGTLITTGDTGTVTSTMIADGTIINADISASAGIVDTKLATISTAGKVSNSATTATNLNTASTIVARDASGDFSAGIITASLNGNASTATALQTPRTVSMSGAITGTATSFDGSANITIPTTVSTTQGGIVYGSSATAYGTTAAGTSGYILSSNGTSAPTWVENTLLAFPGSTFKKSARVATTAALTLNAATATIDGVTLTATDRVLIKNQATASQNGIYTGVTTTTWTRTTDSDSSSDIASAVVAIDEGTANGGRLFTNTFKATDTLGTTAMAWYEVVYNSGTWAISTTGSAATLTTGRTIGMTGDVAWTSTSFNGSANVTGTSTLATITDSGTGTFKKITTDTKGRVTGTQAVAQADITGLLGTGSITNTMLANTAVANLSGTNTGDQTIALTGDVTGSGTGSFATTLANSGVTAGTYSKVTVDGKGRVTAGLVPTMEDIPDAAFKKSARVATTANLVATYASNVLTMSAVGVTTIDGITIALNDRILIKDQTTQIQNGIYRVSTLGTASVATVFTRALDADTSSELAGSIINVDTGTVNGGFAFTNNFKTNDIIGTNAVIFYKLVFENGTWNIAITGNAGTATALATGRTIGMTGDVTWTSASFNGSGNVTGTSTLATIVDSGTGTFKKITTNTKGLVTGTQAVSQTDITGLLGTGSITNTMIANTAVSNLSGTNTGDQTITLTGDITGSGTGSFAATLSNSGVTAGTYSKVTVDAKGRITGGATPTMEDIPDATFKRSVRAATTVNITLSAPQTIDGIALVAGDRVLVKDQTTTSQNGIYVVAAGAWTRALDANTASKIASALVAVDSGTVNGGKLFDNDFKTTDTLGTTAMTWAFNVDSGHLLASTSANIGAVAYNGTTAAAGKFDGGSTTPTGTARLNYGGNFYPTYLNLLGSADTATASSHVFVETASDGFIRPKTLANFKTEMFASPTLVTPNIGVATGTSFNSITGLSAVVGTANGTAAVGTSTAVARADHVHPNDTTKVTKVASTDNAIVRFNGVTGDVQNSLIMIDDAGNIGSGTQSFNGLGGGGFKNYIINGNFGIWQRGTSFTGLTNGTYSSDRWVVYDAVGDINYNVIRNAGVFNTGYGATYSFNSGTTVRSVVQFIENVTRFKVGSNVTISFEAYTNSTPYTVGVAIQGVKGVWASATGEVTSNIALTNTKTKYSVTLPIPDWTSIGIDWAHLEDTKLALKFNLGANTNGRDFTLGSVQLEEGSVATPFEQRPYGLELSLCQRYFEEVDVYWRWDGSLGGLATVSIWSKYSQTKRTIPTVSVHAASNTNISQGAITSNLFGFKSELLFNSGGSIETRNLSSIYVANAEL